MFFKEFWCEDINNHQICFEKNGKCVVKVSISFLGTIELNGKKINKTIWNIIK